MKEVIIDDFCFISNFESMFYCVASNVLRICQLMLNTISIIKVIIYERNLFSHDIQLIWVLRDIDVSNLILMLNLNELSNYLLPLYNPHLHRKLLHHLMAY